MSSSSSKSWYRFRSIFDFEFSINFLISGNFLADAFNEFKSLAFALPYDTFPANLSISYTPFKLDTSSPLIITSSFNSFTALNLLLISFTSINGSFNHLLSKRPPIDVDVLSNTHNNVPFFDLSLSFSVNSRFLLALMSNAIYFVIVYIIILFMCSNFVFCVSSIYCISPFIADTANNLCSKSFSFSPLSQSISYWL